MRRPGLLAVFLLSAVSCAKTLYPITNGSYKALPSEGTAVVVWGSNQHAVAGAEAWLERRALIVVPRAKVREAVNVGEGGEQQIPIKRILTVAAAAGAKLVVLVETASVPAFPGSVSIHAVEAATGEELWQASAWFAAQDIPLAEIDMEALTCQALATLWGFRPAGYHEISSSEMCLVSKTGPHGRPVGPYKKLG